MRKLHSRFPLKLFPVLLFMTTAALFLQGCVSNGGYNTRPWEGNNQPNQQAQQTPNDLSDAPAEFGMEAAESTTINKDDLPTVKVGILLPLSGPHQKLGQAMLNAAQLAIYDVGYSNFELIPQDTKGNAEGAKEAARAALQGGAQLILGPVFSHSVKAARQVTQPAGVNMIAFSTDWTLANNRTFLIGFLPFDQVERVVSYAARQGYGNVAVLSPQDTYGNGIVSAYNSIAAQSGASTVRVERFSPRGTDLGDVVRKFSDYDARKAANNAHGAPFNAVLMPVGGPLARQVGSFLNHYDLPPNQVKRLGTGLMDDTVLATDRTLSGAWFAAPSPKVRQKFEQRYKNFYLSSPPRIASLAYDATALSAILAQIGLRKNNAPAYDHRSITNPNGFAGVDGIFRFRNDGIVERGLAILEYKNGRIIMVDDAPRSFQNHAY